MSEPVTQTPPPVAAPATRSRRRRFLAGGLALLVLLAWFAPAVVANTGLRNRLVRGAAADLNGSVTVGGASLGWFSAVELRDVTLSDSQGRVLAHIPKVATSRTLIGLLLNSSDVGEITIEHPAVEVVCTRDDSNLEDVLRKFLDDKTPPGPTRTPVAVRVVGGTLTLRDAGTGRVGEVTNLDATVSVPGSRSDPIAVKASANAPGRVEVDASVGESGCVKLTAGGLALESLAPLLHRFDPDLTVAGSLTADATVNWAKGAADIDGKLGVKDLAVSDPALNGDTLRLASAELPLKASLAGRTVRVERAEFTSDVGTASVVGSFNSDEPLDALLDKPGVKIDAALDIAKLAALFPKLLRVHDGTEFREGKLTVKVESKAGPQGTAWTGSVSTSALRASRGGKDIHWEEPLSVEFAGRVKAGELPTFDKLVCKSEFVAINAKVSPDSVRAAANVYLDRLAARLADFVDLGGVHLDGQGSAWVVANRSPAGDFKAEGGVELKQFAFADRSGKGLREPALKVTANATGKAPDGGPISVAAAQLTMTAGADELRLKLLEPIPDAKKLAAGKLDAIASGDLGRWQKRVGVATSVLDTYRMGGKALARGTVRFTPDTLNVDRLALAIDNARFVGCGLDIDEPHMNATADLSVNLTTRTTTFDKFTINSAPLSVKEGKLVVESPRGGQLIAYGGGPAATNLNRLGMMTGMFADPAGPTAMYGGGKGPIQFRYTGDVTTFGGSLDITGFAFGPQQQPAWTEPTMRLELDGSYTSSTDTVAFKAAKLERPGFALAGSGSIGKFETTTDANLAGTITYDMAKLTPKLRELVGGKFAAVGKGTKPFSFAGALTPLPKPGSRVPPSVFAAATGELAVGWDAAAVYGFETGQTELRAKLANGVLHLAPVNAVFGGGKVTVEPTVRFEPPPGEATFAKGLLVDHAKLTPAACASAVGYALPAVANAGKAEGEISFRLDEGRVPLGDTQKATVKGALVVHKATLAGGPVLTEVAKLLGDRDGAMTLANEQTVPVRIENGRVHHENLTLKIGAYLVKTTGSVGFDGGLDLVADVPIPGGLPWLKNAPAVAKAVTGKRVRVPVGGTLAAPRLDPQHFQAAVAKLAQDSVKQIGKDLLGKELNKLFPGGMPAPGGGLPTLPGGFFPLPVPKK
jgi:hypothetical protein